MRLWLISIWEEIRDSFWFVPSVMVTAAILLSLGMIQLDKSAESPNWIGELNWTFSRGPEGSRAVLSTVAASMMTIASVTFSITIVALQLASSQFGPRILRNFMRDRGNQVAIGTFIATFTYCLLILRTVNGAENEQFVPHLSVTVGLLLAIVSLGVLIYFIHHAAESIQAENVIAEVSSELQQALDRLYPERLGEGEQAQPTDEPASDLPDNFDEGARTIPSPRSDYLVAVDGQRLLALATERDLVLSIAHRPGKFCTQGDELVKAWPAARVDDDCLQAIRRSFYFGPRRTLTQDIEFAIDQLVEVAVRALSPGINDPFTAISCVDRLGAALCALAERKIPSPYRYDDQGSLRVVTDSSTAAGIVDAAFDQIRQSARGVASVAFRQLETLSVIARHTQAPAFQTALRRQAEAIHDAAQQALGDPGDRDQAKRRFEEVIAALKEA